MGDDDSAALAGVDETGALLDAGEEAGALVLGCAELNAVELPGSEELVVAVELAGGLELPPLPPQATKATDKQIAENSG